MKQNVYWNDDHSISNWFVWFETLKQDYSASKGNKRTFYGQSVVLWCTNVVIKENARNVNGQSQIVSILTKQLSENFNFILWNFADNDSKSKHCTVGNVKSKLSVCNISEDGKR